MQLWNTQAWNSGNDCIQRLHGLFILQHFRTKKEGFVQQSSQAMASCRVLTEVKVI